MQCVHIVLLYQPDVLLLEFAGQRGVLVRIASRVVELVRSCGGPIVKRIVVHDHVVGATLETHPLLVLVRLRRLRRFPMMLLELLAPGSNELIVVLRVDNDLVRIVPVVATIQNLILVLNLIIVGKLSGVVDTYFSAPFT